MSAVETSSSAAATAVNPASVTNNATAGVVPGPNGALVAPSAKQVTAVWVGDLAPDVTEPMLYDIFNAVAPVSNIRVCRDNVTRISLGYAYVNFPTAADAQKAIEGLSYTSIKGRPCRIMISQRDPALRRSNVGNVFIKNLAPELSSRELYETFKVFGTILSCKVALDANGNSKGYGFVHFEEENAGKQALEGVNGLEFGGRVVEVMHYVPRQSRGTVDKWTNLLVKNVPKTWVKKQLDELFAPFGEILSSTIATEDNNGASKGFGFVNFIKHESAVEAINSLNGRDVDSLPNAPPKDAAATAAAAATGAGAGEAAAAAADAAPRPIKLVVVRHMKKAELERIKKEKLEQARRERAQKWAGCNLYIRNIDESIDDEGLRKEFSAHGTIVSAKVSRDPEANRSKGFGFVCFSTAEEASKAREIMNRKMLQGKPLFVTLFESKDAREVRLNQVNRPGFAPGARNSGALGAPGAPGAGAVAGLPAGSQLGGNTGVNFNFMHPQMLANALFAGVAANPQFANMMRSMSPDAMAGLVNNYMANLANAMRMMPQQQQAAAAAAAAQRGGNRAALPANGFPGFNPAMFMNSMGGGAMDPAMVAAAAAGMGGMMGMNGQMVPAGSQRVGGGGNNSGQVAGAGQQRRGGQQGGPAPTGAAPARVASGPGAAGGKPGAAGAAGGQPRTAGGQPQPQQQQGAPRAGAAAGGRPAAANAPGGAGGNVQYRANVQARNVPGEGGAAANGGGVMMPMVPLPAEGMPGIPNAGGSLPPASAATGAPGGGKDTFLQQLASATPQDRKNLIGEQLYSQIQQRQPRLSGKITGMLLDGMEDSELLHLLETPVELEARIREAIEVLEAHEAQKKQ